MYNLTVEGPHEFFANGILVHNCLDVTRYAVMGDRYEGDTVTRTTGDWGADTRNRLK